MRCCSTSATLLSTPPLLASVCGAASSSRMTSFCVRPRPLRRRVTSLQRAASIGASAAAAESLARAERQGAGSVHYAARGRLSLPFSPREPLRRSRQRLVIRAERKMCAEMRRNACIVQNYAKNEKIGAHLQESCGAHPINGLARC